MGLNDIAYQFFEIGILLANNGFVTILKKLTMPFVSEVKGYRIPC